MHSRRGRWEEGVGEWLLEKKILEKIVLSQPQTHLKENLLEENQSAYRKYHSTETALSDVTSALFN